jgi:hypothetical protein
MYMISVQFYSIQFCGLQVGAARTPGLTYQPPTPHPLAYPSRASPGQRPLARSGREMADRAQRFPPVGVAYDVIVSTRLVSQWQAPAQSERSFQRCRLLQRIIQNKSVPSCSFITSLPVCLHLNFCLPNTNSFQKVPCLDMHNHSVATSTISCIDSRSAS